MQRILLIDDEAGTRGRILSVFVARGHNVLAERTASAGLAAFAAGEFDLVVAQLSGGAPAAMSLVRALRGRRPDQEVVLVGGADDSHLALAAFRAGASDYLPAPLDNAALAEAAGRCLERALVRRERLRLLDENLEFFHHEMLYQRCLGLLATLELEKLQELALADLCAVCDAQSGALWVADERDTLVLRAYRGLVDRHRLPARIDPRSGPFAPGIAARSPFMLDGAADAVAGSFYLPLVAASDPVGLALVGDKLRGQFTHDDQRAARALGDFAATALRNARRYQAMERLGLRDPETATYHLGYFVDYAAKEIYKARRYARTFSLITLAVENLDAVRADLGADAAKAVTRTILGGLARVIRDADVVAKASDGEFYVLLPETDHFGAAIFARRAIQVARSEIAARVPAAGAPVSLYAGSATFPGDGEDFDELVHAGRARLAEARESLSARLVLDGLDFWGVVDLLLGRPGSPPLPRTSAGGPTRRGPAPPGLFAQVQCEAGREVGRTPGARGVAYVGGVVPDGGLPVLAGLEHAPQDAATRVFLLGRHGAGAFASHPNATAVFLDGDERLVSHEFLLLFTEMASYALLLRRGDGAEPPWAFHTCDATLVDALVDKLEKAYDLHPY